MSNINTKRYRMATYDAWGRSVRFFSDIENQISYFCLSDLAAAVDNTTVVKWGEKGQIPTVRISSKDCETPFRGASIVTVLWDDFKKMASNQLTTDYHNTRICSFINHFDPLWKKEMPKEMPKENVELQTYTQPQQEQTASHVSDILENEPIHTLNVDDFVDRMHTLLEENRQLKERVATLEHRLSEYEAVKDMLLSL